MVQSNTKPGRDMQAKSGRTASWSSIVAALVAPPPAVVPPPEPPRFNPRPPGSVMPDSVTAKVLDALRAHPDRWMHRSDLTWRLREEGRSTKSIDWALIRARAAGRIEAREDSDGRLVYRWPRPGPDPAKPPGAPEAGTV